MVKGLLLCWWRQTEKAAGLDHPTAFDIRFDIHMTAERTLQLSFVPEQSSPVNINLDV